MTSITITPCPIDGLFLLTRQISQDSRGRFERLYSASDIAEHCAIDEPIDQINRSITLGRGTVRGLHYQNLPHEEIKIVTCVSGSVFDVAVDIRPGSPTYLKYHVTELAENKPTSVLIGKGFAHGFQTLAETSELLYLHTAVYAPESEGRLHVSDPAIGIVWPLQVTGLSKRDEMTPFLAQLENHRTAISRPTRTETE